MWGMQHIWERGEVLVEKPEGRRLLGYVGMDGRIKMEF